MPQTQFFLFLYLVPLKLLTKQFVMLQQHTNVYQHRRVSRDAKQINNRKDDALLACLRSGHHPLLKQYLNRLDPSQDQICRNCHLEEQDLLHWLCEYLAFMTINVWEPSTVLRVACRSTCGCSGVRKGRL